MKWGALAQGFPSMFILKKNLYLLKAFRGQNPAPGLEPVCTPHQSHVAEQMTALKQTQWLRWSQWHVISTVVTSCSDLYSRRNPLTALFGNRARARLKCSRCYFNNHACSLARYGKTTNRAPIVADRCRMIFTSLLSCSDSNDGFGFSILGCATLVIIRFFFFYIFNSINKNVNQEAQINKLKYPLW